MVDIYIYICMKEEEEDKKHRLGTKRQRKEYWSDELLVL